MTASILGFTVASKAVQSDGTVQEHSPDIKALTASSGVVSSSVEGLMNVVDIRVECIDEERLGLGIGDYADVTFLGNVLSSIYSPPLGPYEVTRVDNSKTAVLRIRTLSDKWSEIADQLLTKIKAGKATIKKVKECTIPSIYKKNYL